MSVTYFQVAFAFVLLAAFVAMAWAGPAEEDLSTAEQRYGFGGYGGRYNGGYGGYGRGYGGYGRGFGGYGSPFGGFGYY